MLEVLVVTGKGCTVGHSRGCRLFIIGIPQESCTYCSDSYDAKG